MLLVVHDAPIDLPAHLRGEIRLATDSTAPLDLEHDDIVLWGKPPEFLHLEAVPICRALLSPDPSAVDRARRAGWRAILLPDLGAKAIERAVLGLDSLLAVDGGTLVPELGVIWVEGDAVPLPRTERELLACLLSAEGGPVSRLELARALGLPRDSRAIDAAIYRLRSRIGPAHVLGSRREGWRLRLLPSGPVVLKIAESSPRQIGDLRIDLDRRQVVRPGEPPIAISAREAAALGLFLDTPGVTSRRALAAALGDATDSAKLDVLVCRLRKKLGMESLQTVRGLGWHIVSPSEARAAPSAEHAISPELARVLESVRAGVLTVITGGPGVGKSHLARQAASALGLHVLDAHGVRPERVVRLMERSRSADLLVDGLDDPEPVAEALAAHASAGRLLVTSRARPGSTGEICIPLPFASFEPPEALARRLGPADREPRQTLAILAAFEGSFSQGDARAVVGRAVDLERLGRMNLLQPEPEEMWRLWPKLREALAQEVPAAARDAHARRTLAQAREALEARPYVPERAKRWVADVRAAIAHAKHQSPEIAARLLALWSNLSMWSALPDTADPFAEILRAPLPADLRAQMWFHYSQSNGIDHRASVDALTRALDGKSEMRWTALLVLVLHERHRDPARADARWQQLLEEIRARPGEASLYLRAQIAIIEAIPLPHPLRLEKMRAALIEVERERWDLGVTECDRSIRDARADLLIQIGESLAALGRLDSAEDALRQALEIGSALVWDPVRYLLSGILARRGRLGDAERLLESAILDAKSRKRDNWTPMFWARRAILVAMYGDPRRVEPMADEAERLAARRDDINAQRDAAHARSIVAMRAGDVCAVERLSVSAATAGKPLGRALLAIAGLVQSQRGEIQRDLADVEEALAELETTSPGTAEALRSILERDGLAQRAQVPAA